MIRDALEYIVKLAAPTVQEIAGITYSDKSLLALKPPAPHALDVATLTGLVEYINRDPDTLGDNDHNLILHIESPWAVRLISSIEHQHKHREHYLSALYDTNLMFKFGQQMEVESFIIAVLSRFEETQDRQRLLKLVGNMKAEHVATAVDDGVSQTVATRIGAVMADKADVNNPFALTPHRTFAEARQPQSDFILRLHQHQAEMPRCALYETDNGAWKAEAMATIKTWLQEKIDHDLTVLA